MTDHMRPSSSLPRAGDSGGGRAPERLHALVTLPTEVHSIPGWADGETFRSDRAHEMTPDCDCKPVVYWKSSAAPKPLYEHRDVDGSLAPDEGPVQ